MDATRPTDAEVHAGDTYTHDDHHHHHRNLEEEENFLQLAVSFLPNSFDVEEEQDTTPTTRDDLQHATQTEGDREDPEEYDYSATSITAVSSPAIGEKSDSSSYTDEDDEEEVTESTAAEESVSFVAKAVGTTRRGGGAAPTSDTKSKRRSDSKRRASKRPSCGMKAKKKHSQSAADRESEISEISDHDSSSTDEDDDDDHESARPKRPLSAYNYFFQWKRKQLVCRGRDKESPLTFSTIGKLIGGEWQEMTKEDRASYVHRAKRDQERYAREIKLWRKERSEQRRRLRRRRYLKKQEEKKERRKKRYEQYPPLAVERKRRRSFEENERDVLEESRTSQRPNTSIELLQPKHQGPQDSTQNQTSEKHPTSMPTDAAGSNETWFFPQFGWPPVKVKKPNTSQAPPPPPQQQPPPPQQSHGTYHPPLQHQQDSSCHPFPGPNFPLQQHVAPPAPVPVPHRPTAPAPINYPSPMPPPQTPTTVNNYPPPPPPQGSLPPPPPPTLGYSTSLWPLQAPEEECSSMESLVARATSMVEQSLGGIKVQYQLVRMKEHHLPEFLKSIQEQQHRQQHQYHGGGPQGTDTASSR